MAVTIRSNTANKDVWNEWSDQLDAVIIDADANETDDDKLLKSLALVRDSKKFAEKSTTIGTLGNFQAKAEGTDAAEDTFEEGYDSLLRHIAFALTVTLSRELADDGNIDMMKARAANLVQAYKRSRAQYITDVLTKSVGTTTTMDFGGETGINIAAPDGKAIFAADHPLKSVSGTSQGNLFSDDLEAATNPGELLNRLANAMRNFKDDRGNVEGLLADTIVIPGNAPKLEDTVKKIIGSDGEVGNDLNDINTQRGKWKLVVDHLWTPETTKKPYIVTSSRGLKSLVGTVFYNRTALDVLSEVKTESRNLVYNGFARWSAGANNWRHLIMGGSSDTSAVSISG